MPSTTLMPCRGLLLLAALTFPLAAQTGPVQIRLHLRIAQVDDAVIDLSLGTAAGAAELAPKVSPIRADMNLAAMLQALEARGALRILAEPNLTIADGGEATFRAGGEFPYPNLKRGPEGTSVTVTFQQYGLLLGFQPRLTEQGGLHLQVSPEVTGLDFANATVLQGFSIPSLSVRKVRADVDLVPGQSFAIAGLLDQQTLDSWSKIPGVSGIPVLGALLQRADPKAKLVILVTPEVVTQRIAAL